MSDIALQNGAAGGASAAAILSLLGSRSIVLVGMMGVGKSSIGRRLAARLNIPFVDADTEIEKAAGMSIPDIFARHGEADFRSGEARVIARLTSAASMRTQRRGADHRRQRDDRRVLRRAVVDLAEVAHREMAAGAAE